MSGKLTKMKVTGEVSLQTISGYAPSGMSFHVADLNGDGYDDILVMGLYWPSPDNPPPDNPPRENRPRENPPRRTRSPSTRSSLRSRCGRSRP